MQDVLGLILGGGRGHALYPLTKLRSKPAVPIAGKYRLIDIALSNCINSGIHRLYVVTQHLSVSLHRHIANTYQFEPFRPGFVVILAAQQTNEATVWYRGTADAVRQQTQTLGDENAKDLLVLFGDQLFRADFRALLNTHRETQADVTMAVHPVSADDASRLGVTRLDATGRIVEFVEAPGRDRLAALRLPAAGRQRHGLPPDPGDYLASTGIYLFRRRYLFDLLHRLPDADDFGRDIFPRVVATDRVQAHLFGGYWEDLESIRSFHSASLALASDEPPFDFHTPDGIIYTSMRNLPASRVCTADLKESLISDGCFIERGTRLERAVVGIRSRVGPDVTLRDTVVSGADRYETDAERAANRRRGTPDIGIGAGSWIERAILDRDCRIGQQVQIRGRCGLADAEGDNYVVRDGIVIIPNGATVPDGAVIPKTGCATGM